MKKSKKRESVMRNSHRNFSSLQDS